MEFYASRVASLHHSFVDFVDFVYFMCVNQIHRMRLIHAMQAYMYVHVYSYLSGTVEVALGLTWINFAPWILQ